MGIYAIKPTFQKTLRPLENLFVRYKVHPTVVNLLGLLCASLGAIGILLSPKHPWTLILTAVAVNVRTACNALDGLVARRLGVASRFGEVLNELIDRFNDTILFLAVYALAATNNNLALFTLIVILLNSFLSILSKAAGASRQYGGIVGKADRMIYMSITAVVVLISDKQFIWNYFLWFILVTTSITFCQRFIATRRELPDETK
jgi:CDP-diacylglycerol--glycerol-3-phosphate 3-phosphatidyltransferase